MIRMLLVGHVLALRSEPRLCSELQVNLAYRWFCKHFPVWDKSARSDGTFSRADFIFDQERNVYVCPGGAELTGTGNIDQGHIVYYRANKKDCSGCTLKAAVHHGSHAQSHPRPQRGCAR
jgi:Transposase domain (DUF772)